VLEKPESWCSQQVASCKTEVVASKGVGAHKNDNVQNIKDCLSFQEEEVFSLYGFPHEYLSLCISCV
jgi:hypothetical protein